MKHIDPPMRPHVREEVAAGTLSAARSSNVTPVLLTEDEAAAVLGVSKRTFLNLRAESWMPLPIVLGPRMHRYSVDELRAAVSNMPRQTQRTQPESLLRSRIERAKTTGNIG